MGVQNMGRPFDKHIDDQELNALVPSSSESGQELHRLCPDAVREASRGVMWGLQQEGVEIPADLEPVLECGGLGSRTAGS